VLGPPLIPAQENHDPFETINPTFELAYWAYGLNLAQQWRERQGLAREKAWDDVIAKLAPLPQQDGAYLAHENCPDTFTRFNYDHFSTMAAWGMIPGPNVDLDVMKSTLEKTISDWRWDQVWGWDFPMIAMTAARLNLPKTAIDMLMMDVPRNACLKNGHNSLYGCPAYLSYNGGILVAIAMMCAGWEGGPETHAPGFPDDGAWQVRHEGLRRFL
jgi:hypothetical protein